MNPTGKTNTGALWVRLTALACFTYNLIELYYYNNNRGAVSKGKYTKMPYMEIKNQEI